MDFTVKVNVDASEVIEKLERIKNLYREINELKNEKPVINSSVKNEADIPSIKAYIKEENVKNNNFNLL
ncbi:hypothetical protein [Staphylococcus delphini]|uniref:hypothetical protein n=1 Tax=Staphylococcus delphini TaxID=53344 RepID=UPI000BBC6390|nr:hypothetical protein [Staphylococcus delphini]PCF81448.1 hypothetical protein B4W69_12900 [Staphylococcus delphini]